MSAVLSGPMFEWAESGPWRSSYSKAGAHYNIYSTRDTLGMPALREMFPSGQADEMNAVLFSTSGVHGTYSTIEEAELDLARGNRDEDGNETTPSVTFLIIHPRIVCLRYGNCHPQTTDDIDYLKRLRESSWTALSQIGQS